MALSVPEKIAQVAEHFASHSAHGYSQPNRGTGATETVKLSDGTKVTVTGSDVDCSEMVRQCVNAAMTGSHKAPIAYMWTGSEDAELRAQGFARMAFAKSKVKRGDVLWRSGHTAVATSASKQAEAAIDERGGITGPTRGDQTGSEVAVNALSSNWAYIYRHGGSQAAQAPVACSFGVTVTGETNVRSGASMSAAVTGQLPAGYRVACDGWLQADGRLWATYVAESGGRRYVSLGTAHDWAVVS